MAISSEKFEATTSVFNITDGNKRFPITTPGSWNSKSAKRAIAKLSNLLQLRSQNDTEIHVEQVRRNG